MIPQVAVYGLAVLDGGTGDEGGSPVHRMTCSRPQPQRYPRNDAYAAIRPRAGCASASAIMGMLPAGSGPSVQDSQCGLLGLSRSHDQSTKDHPR